MNPSIKMLPETKLIGMRVQMNFIANKTQELWQRFMPRKMEIEGILSKELFSVEIYSSPTYFDQFNPGNKFEKWAAVPVASSE